MGAYRTATRIALSRPNIAGAIFFVGDKGVTINGEPVTIRIKNYGPIDCALCGVQIQVGDMHGRGPNYRAFCLDDVDECEDA